MNTIGYIRLSRKDQSKYSFDGQESAIKAYCKKYGLQLLSIFRDNGECSDTFNRTNFKALKHFLCQNKGKVKYLIVMDHDRFSRDLSKALFKINELKRRHGVTVLSTEEPIDINTSDPQVFISRTLKYAMANLELLNIRNRLKRGIKNAMESGRFVRRAPFGYQNDRDVSDRSILSIKENEAPIVQKIFQDYLAGVPLFLIYKEIRRFGFPNTGNGSVRRTLQNCVYAGLIKVNSSEDSIPTYVRALHEPIIAEKDYWLVQSKLNKKHIHRTQPREDFPLRGILSCRCGLNMTAGWSKGKTKRYLYYRCIRHSSVNLPGTILHEKLIRLLHHLRFNADDLNYLKELSKQKLTVALRINAKQLSERKTTKQALSRNVDNLEERLIKGDISHNVYEKWQLKFIKEETVIKRQIKQLTSDRREKQERLFELLIYLTSVWDIYEKVSGESKFALLNKIFPAGIRFIDSVFTTSELDETLQHNLELLKEKRLLLSVISDAATISQDKSSTKKEKTFLDFVSTSIVDFVMRS